MHTSSWAVDELTQSFQQNQLAVHGHISNVWTSQLGLCVGNAQCPGQDIAPLTTAVIKEII